MSWRVAKSLLVLRQQVNEAFPNRKKDSDGTIGDARHQAESTSDHNPWVDGGIVTAMDITHDPAHGLDSYVMADQLKSSGDGRIKYVISNSRIWNPSISPDWRHYRGSNPHNKHVHISVKSDHARYDDETKWVIPMLTKEG